MSFAPRTPQARSVRSDASSVISTDRPLSARVLDRLKHVARQQAAKEGGKRPETSEPTARATLKMLGTSKRRPQRLGGNLLDVPDVDECDVTGFRRVGDWCICEICTCGYDDLSALSCLGCSVLFVHVSAAIIDVRIIPLRLQLRSLLVRHKRRLGVFLRCDVTWCS